MSQSIESHEIGRTDPPVSAVSPTDVLDEIYRHRQVVDRQGKSHPLHSEITKDEGSLLARLIEEHSFTRTLEIGCAFGVSSLFICGALARRGIGKHTIVDPGQSGYWNGIGIANLERCGLQNFDLIERPSEFVLPELVQQKRTFQFALIDGFHTFDHVLLDFFFVNRMLELGGVVVLDDLQLPGIKRVARYIAKYPNYRVVAHAKQAVFPGSLKKRVVDGILHIGASLLPSQYAANQFSDSFFVSDEKLGLISEMVAFQKTGPDERDSHWYKSF